MSEPPVRDTHGRLGRIFDLGGDTMGTSWSVRVVGPERFDAAAIRSGIERQLDTIIAQMSNWESESTISRFNRARIGEWQLLPAEFCTVLRAGLEVAEASGGAFDPAIGQFVDHWGFGPGGQKTVSEAASARLPGAVSAPWRAIELQGDRGRRMANVALDFSGIAKGFAVDRVSLWLEEQGFPAHLVEIGGELRGQGVKPDGQPWWVDWEVPPGLSLSPVCFALYGLGVATSGDYRRWFQRDGVRISHSIDSRSGAPVANSLASVTVLHEQAMMADAWATALIVLGLEQGLALAAQQDLAVLMVRREGAQARDYMSPAFSAMLD